MFTPIKSILPRSVDKIGIKRELDGNQICAVYNKIVEEVLNKKAAQNSRALFFRNRILTVAVPSSVWACQLQFAQHKLLQRINKLAGQKMVERIVFRVR